MSEKDIQIDLEEGQHYEHKRGDIYTIKYLDESVVLIYDGRNNRLEDREYFEKAIESTEFKLRPDLDITDSDSQIPFEKIDWIGEKGIENLQREKITRPVDFERKTDDRILEIDAVGEKGLENIKEWIENNETNTIEL
jgi:hypothetical protein